MLSSGMGIITTVIRRCHVAWVCASGPASYLGVASVTSSTLFTRCLWCLRVSTRRILAGGPCDSGAIIGTIWRGLRIRLNCLRECLICPSPLLCLSYFCSFSLCLRIWLWGTSARRWIFIPTTNFLRTRTFC